MKKLLIPLAVLVMLCMCLTAMGEEAVTLEIRNPGKLPLYEASDPWLEGLTAGGNSDLPVLVLSVKKGVQLQTTVKPQSLRNKKVTLTAEDPEILRVQGSTVTGLKAGETLLTIASEADPQAALSLRVVVVQPVTRLSLRASEKSVAVGGTIQLTADAQPESATRKQVVWTSADERIATVDAEGRVTGVKKGTARIVATAADGSKTRANISVQVTQNAEEIQLDRTEITVDVKRTAVLKATVLPKNANDRSVVWSSSDESIATVNRQGRVTGVALGDCEIICASSSGNVQARATVHVQQPVKSVVFDSAPFVYVNESARLTWHVEPADATNPAVVLTSANPKVLTVSEDGTVTGVRSGEAYVNAITTDGSNRRARVKVKVGQHVESVRMTRRTAYIDRGTTSTTGAQISPKDASNKNMTWESADPSIATVSPAKKQPWRVNITGVSSGETTITGTTEDGGFQTSMTVKVGSYEHALELDKQSTYVEGADIVLRVRNVSDLTITSVTAEVTVTDVDGNPVPCNSKDNSATFKVVYKGTLAPGAYSKNNQWKYVNFKLPDSMTVAQYEVRITEFQIDNDWVKTIRKKNQPSKKCPVHI